MHRVFERSSNACMCTRMVSVRATSVVYVVSQSPLNAALDLLFALMSPSVVEDPKAKSACMFSNVFIVVIVARCLCQMALCTFLRKVQRFAHLVYWINFVVIINGMCLTLVFP